MTLAVLVVGAESSGNRLMTRLLVHAGCAGGSLDGDLYRQALDDYIQCADGTPVVWLRSFPHAKSWAKIPDMADALRQHGYTVKTVVMLRDWNCQRLSQIAVGHSRDDDHAKRKVREAYVRIFAGLEAAGLTYDYVPVVYEALVAHPVGVLTDLLSELGLPTIDVASMAEDVFDADAKYYQEYSP